MGCSITACLLIACHPVVGAGSVSPDLIRAETRIGEHLERSAADVEHSTKVPALIDDIVKAGGLGIANAKGFYQYTEEEALLWAETFTGFSYEIRQLALKYPADYVKHKLVSG